jgi:hypothetical protein
MPGSAAAFAPSEATVMVVPWHDPVVDTVGHDVRSAYVEMFWLNVLGPTALWALRRLVHGLDRFPLGYEMELADTATALGLSYSPHTSNTFLRALQRCVLFGVSQPVPDGLAVRRRLPPVANRHLARMPLSLQSMHEDWRVREVSIDQLHRGRLLADAMVRAGDDADTVERQLMAAGVPPHAAEVVTEGLRDVSGRSAGPDR